MKKIRALRVIEQLALHEKKSVTQMREEMKIAIKAGFEKKNKDKIQENFWSKWENPPTPEEFIAATITKRMEELGF